MVHFRLLRLHSMARSENGGQGLPCAFSLLPNKRGETYELMLNKIFELVGDNRALSTVICDFEQSIWRSMAVFAPDVDRRGCQFHYRKAIYTKLGELGLQAFYNGNVEFNEIMHRVFALSFVPVEDVVQFYEEQIVSAIEEKIENNDIWRDGSEELEDFIRYMDRTWIGKIGLPRNGREASRRPPLFHHDMWNVYKGILENDPVMTNNGMESWNRTWNQEMGVKPNMWKVIKGFVKTESETKRILVTNAAGRDLNSNTGRKSLVKNQYERISNIVRQYVTLPSVEYINLIAHELSLH